MVVQIYLTIVHYRGIIQTWHTSDCVYFERVKSHFDINVWNNSSLISLRSSDMVFFILSSAPSKCVKPRNPSWGPAVLNDLRLGSLPSGGVTMFTCLEPRRALLDAPVYPTEGSVGNALSRRRDRMDRRDPPNFAAATPVKPNPMKFGLCDRADDPRRSRLGTTRLDLAPTEVSPGYECLSLREALLVCSCTDYLFYICPQANII